MKKLYNRVKDWLARHKRIRKGTEPLIFTSKGNVPISSLQPREVRWTVDTDYIKLEYFYRDFDGNVVHQGADVLSRRGVMGEAVIGVLK